MKGYRISLRRLAALGGVLVFGVVWTLPLSLAAGQNKKPAEKPARSKPESGKGRKAESPPARQERPAAPPNGRPELRVVPLTSGQGGQMQIRLQTGPDGKPVAPGADGRSAAPGTGGAVPVAITSPPPAPGGTIMMDFRGSDIGNVLKFFAMATNWQIVPDANLTGPVTIISPKSLTIEQAFQVLQSTLEVRGFSGQLEQRGNTTILKIVPLDRAVQSTTLLSDNGKKLSPEELKNQVITQVIPIDNVDAKALAGELTPLINKGASLVASVGTNALIITDTASNVQRMGELVQMLDKAASNSDIEKFPLRYSDATTVAEALNSLFGRVFSRGRGGQPQGQPGQPQPQPQVGPDGRPIQPPQERGAIVAVPDTRTNSVFVVASKDNMERVRKIIADMDDPQAGALKTRYVQMKYADAVDVADTINSVLSGAGTTRQGGGQQGASFRQRVFGGDGFGGGEQPQQQQTVFSSDPFAKVVANARTNSLIITATEEKMKVIEELIAQLDVEVAVESTTFVIPLKNAQAQDMAYVLSQAFGTAQQQFNPFGGFFGFFGGGFGGRQQRQRIQRRQGQQQRNSGFGRSASIGFAPNGLPYDVSDPDGVHGTLTPNGFVPDDVSSDEPTSRGQFFFNPFGRGGQRETPQFGRGRSGQYVNLLQLRNNVGVTADINSNSLIITTTPDNMRVLQEIIDSLDVVPRQVMIEVIIAEASVDATQKLGFQFDAKGVGKIFGTSINQSGFSNFPLGPAGNVSGNVSTPINPGGQYAIQALNGKFNALVQALTTDTRVRILATPKIFTSNNQEAEILITTNIPYVANQFSGGFSSSVSFDVEQVGIILNVTPRITKDGLVTIDVVATSKELLGFDTVTTGVDTNGRAIIVQNPRTSERTTDTSVSVRDGEIVALGGLMREGKSVTTNKIPLLGDIPLFGHLFRNTTTRTDKTELMLFMVPHVVDGDAQNRALIEQQSKNVRKEFPNLEKQQPAINPDGARSLPERSPDRNRPMEERKP